MMVIDLANDKMNDGISRAIELLRYKGERELADQFEKWIPPKFLVSGGDLKAAGVLRKFNYCLKSKDLFIFLHIFYYSW